MVYSFIFAKLYFYLNNQGHSRKFDENIKKQVGSALHKLVKLSTFRLNNAKKITIRNGLDFLMTKKLFQVSVLSSGNEKQQTLFSILKSLAFTPQHKGKAMYCMRCKVSCGGLVQLGSYLQVSPWQIPLRLRLTSLLYSRKSSRQLKTKNTHLNLYYIEVNWSFFLQKLIVDTHLSGKPIQVTKFTL